MTSKHSLLWAAVVFAVSIAVTVSCGNPSTGASKSAGTGGGDVAEQRP